MERRRARLFADRLRAARLTARPTATMGAMPPLGQVAVLALGGWLAHARPDQLGTFLAFASYLAALVGPARLLSGLVIIGQQARRRRGSGATS